MGCALARSLNLVGQHNGSFLVKRMSVVGQTRPNWPLRVMSGLPRVATELRASRARITAIRVSSTISNVLIVTVGYRAPFRLHDVVQVVVFPPMQDLQTLTHWLICFAS
jgi:hypothetical protein